MPPIVGFPNPVTVWSKGVSAFRDYVQHYRDETLEWLGVMTPPNDTWRQLSAHWKWNASTDPKDDMYCTFDIMNVTGGALDPSWTTADYTSVESKFDTFFASVAAVQTSGITLIEYRWYIRSFNDYSNPKPFAPHGSPERLTTKAIVGTAGVTSMAPQTAMSVTEKTNFPRNWGRFYIPGICQVVVASGVPKITSTYVDSIATAYSTLNSSLASSQFQLVVPITRLGTGSRGDPGAGTPNRRLSMVQSVKVDNVFDVIRRRRTHAVTYSKVLP